MSFVSRILGHHSLVGLGAFIGAAMLHPGAILAADEAPDASAPGGIQGQLGGWQVVLGGGALIAPEYEGGDTYEIVPIPFVTATFGGWLTVDPTGATAEVYDSGPFSFAAKVGYETGRDEDDADALRGMGDVDLGVTVGGRAAVSFGQAELFGSVEKTIGGSEGLLLVAGVEMMHVVTPSLFLGAGVSATYADANHMEAYFGVDAAQAQRSGYQRFDAGAGFKRVDLGVSATYNVTENWFLRSEAGVGLLVGDAADSPIVRDEVQGSGMLIAGYRF